MMTDTMLPKGIKISSSLDSLLKRAVNRGTGKDPTATKKVPGRSYCIGTLSHKFLAHSVELE